MAHRHEVQKKARGGGTAPKHDAKKLAYNAQGSNVVKEAEEKKRGGKAEHKAHGKKGKARLDKRARGGAIHGHGSHSNDMKKSPFSAAHIAPHTPAGAPHPHRGK